MPNFFEFGYFKKYLIIIFLIENGAVNKSVNHFGQN